MPLDDDARSRLMDAVGTCFARNDRFLLTTHITPDGDGLGSALALARALRLRGKEARLVNCSASPDDLRFLPQRGEYQVWSPRRHRKLLDEAQVVVATDLGGAERMGRMLEPVRRAKATKVLFDHHVHDGDPFDLVLIDEEASSTAEIVWRLFHHLDIALEPELAIPLYVGLVTDTGNFAYSATSPTAHRMAGELLAAGADPQAIWQRLHCQVPLAKLRFLGRCLERLETTADGRVVWLAVPAADLEAAGLPARDAFEVVNHMLKLGGAEVAVFLLEVDPHRTKVSFRSAGQVSVHGFARRHGGGGHRFAAGCVLDQVPLERAVPRVLDEVAAALPMKEEVEKTS